VLPSTYTKQHNRVPEFCLLRLPVVRQALSGTNAIHSDVTQLVLRDGIE
jgi:hypothetical protein